jgi:hypothetical protein
MKIYYSDYLIVVDQINKLIQMDKICEKFLVQLWMKLSLIDMLF